MGFAKELRKGRIASKSEVKNDLVLLLDNVYDTFNVGGMYRVGDASGVSFIYHCGTTPSPPDPKIKRAAVGLDDYIKHEAVPDILVKMKELRKDGYTLIALEQAKNAQLYDCVKYAGKIALIVGNETFGVSENTVRNCDFAVELPMYGINKSLNVVVATGIALYEIRRKLG